jgi:hypothetical protein
VLDESAFFFSGSAFLFDGRASVVGQFEIAAHCDGQGAAMLPEHHDVQPVVG